MPANREEKRAWRAVGDYSTNGGKILTQNSGPGSAPCVFNANGVRKCQPRATPWRRETIGFELNAESVGGALRQKTNRQHFQCCLLSAKSGLRDSSKARISTRSTNWKPYTHAPTTSRHRNHGPSAKPFRARTRHAEEHHRSERNTKVRIHGIVGRFATAPEHSHFRTSDNSSLLYLSPHLPRFPPAQIHHKRLVQRLRGIEFAVVRAGALELSMEGRACLLQPL
jgi:hypothetical protein